MSSMAVPVRIPNGPLYMDIDGFRLNSCFTSEVFRKAVNYKPEPGDKFVVSYPKTGTTWTQQIVYLIFHEGVPPSTPLEFHSNSPFVDLFGFGDANRNVKSRLLKTHLPFNLVPKSSEAKYIYMCRNPKDTCVSYFYHTRRFSCYDFQNGKFQVFFDVFINGDVDYGDYFDHVLSWYEHCNDANILFINYEEMKHDQKRFVLKIAEFLSEEHHQLLLQNERILENVLQYSGIQFMKDEAKELFENLYEKPLDESTPNFIRKGVVGDWKGYFNDEMNARMEQKILEMFSDTDLIDVWRKYGIV
uniref:Putative sulfotransferase n=1 Tax=Ixodes ricinus TaxID=34613 RepID=A0A0K8RET1_IXORI